MGLNCPAQLAAKKMPATSPRSWWASLGEVFSLGYISLIVFFMACFIFENLLEADTISIEELVLVFLVLVASLFLWCYQQAKGSKIHQKQLHAQKVHAGKSFTGTCVARLQAGAELLSINLFSERHLYQLRIQTACATQLASTASQATKDEDQERSDTKSAEVQPEQDQQQPQISEASQATKDEDQERSDTKSAEVQLEQDQQQPHTSEALTCASKQQLKHAFLVWRHQLHEFDVTQPALVDICSLESVTQMFPTQTQSESLRSTKTTGNFMTVADELPAYVILQQSRLCGPQSPIDKIPSSPLQHDEKILPGLQTSIKDIQKIAKQIHRFGPQSPADKVPSLPQMREEKLFPNASREQVSRPQSPADKVPSLPQMHEVKMFPKVSHAKAWRLMNRTRAPVSQSSA